LLKKSRCDTTPQKPLKPIGSGCGKFQAFTRSKSPESLSAVDVKEFLTWLAVKKEVAASTQNQAFNSLSFFIGTFCKRRRNRVKGILSHPITTPRELLENIRQQVFEFEGTVNVQK
jgi:hypothetical protein